MAELGLKTVLETLCFFHYTSFVFLKKVIVLLKAGKERSWTYSVFLVVEDIFALGLPLLPDNER